MREKETRIQRAKELLPVCPHGTLSRLQPHQAFVSLAGRPHPEPVLPVYSWPDIFEESPETQAKSSPSISKMGDENDEAICLSQAHTRRLMQQLGLNPILEIAAFKKAVLVTDRLFANDPRAGLMAFFARKSPLVPMEAGLATLPLSWCAGILGLLDGFTRRSTHGIFGHAIQYLGCIDGHLTLRLYHETAEEYQGWNPAEHRTSDNLRMKLQLSLYPCLYRPLKQRTLMTMKNSF